MAHSCSMGTICTRAWRESRAVRRRESGVGRHARVER
jgi:hypothetical protein